MYPSLTALPTPSFSPTIITYTTTDASGHTITGTTTSSVPVYPTPTGRPTPSLSPTIVTYTTTDASGHTITGTTTSSVIVYPSSSSGATQVTNPAGSSSAANPVTATSVAPTGVASPCPAGIDSSYFDSKGNQYTLFCNTNFLYNDLPSTQANTFAQCIDACTAYVPTTGGFGDLPCVAVTWTPINSNGNNCYLKSSIQNVVYGTSTFMSAKILSYSPVFGSLSVSVVTPTATVNAFTISTTYSTYQSPSPCPLSNSTGYTDAAGVQYQVQCGVVYTGDDLPAAYVNSFEDCMHACSSYVPPLTGR